MYNNQLSRQPLRAVITPGHWAVVFERLAEQVQNQFHHLQVHLQASLSDDDNFMGANQVTGFTSNVTVQVQSSQDHVTWTDALATPVILRPGGFVTFDATVPFKYVRVVAYAASAGVLVGEYVIQQEQASEKLLCQSEVQQSCSFSCEVNCETTAETTM